MPKLNSPLPQPLPKECAKAAKIFRSFVDSGNNGLDGVIPRSIIENAKGFAIFTIFKAGFLFSARAGTGVVIAKTAEGTWSAPSAIGTAGVGFGGQAGAEMTDFLIVLNSRSKSFMAAGSLTLGGNASIAIGPLGRNGEATGALNTNGKVAAMYSYSKTRGLFGGISIEGSVIVERQDANVQAYQNDQVSVKLLLSGAIAPPPWAKVLTDTIEACTGLPGNRKWVQDEPGQSPGLGNSEYAFGGLASPGAITPNSMRKLKKDKSPYPPPSWGEPKEGGSYFNSSDSLHYGSSQNTHNSIIPSSSSRVEDPWNDSTSKFDTTFASDFMPEEELRKKTHRMSLSLGNKPTTSNDPFDSFNSSSSLSHQRSISLASPNNRSFSSSPYSNPFAQTDETLSPPALTRNASSQPYITPKPELTKPLLPHEGVARAIALYDFQAAEPGDLGFSKGEVIIITEKSDSTDDWWTGKINDRKGIFPANFVEVV
ncbi:DUF500-domain-containing protein [Dendrothele bispora CBS 962.96]|uniref:DUF500-domain-containing protein n=1 Tax=Dendrothele bispora (strain CBS 962.96) TaxID=1314807 RepID=A0A4V4HID1_DENBC|nr:DUF500-domain-containing protein [Dendrothele bispora CBS 962.96]